MATKTKARTSKTKTPALKTLKKRGSARRKSLAPLNLPIVDDNTSLDTIANFDGVVSRGEILDMERPAVAMTPFAVAPQAPMMYPNTSFVQPIRVEIRSDGAILKSARAGFYLGVIVGVISMSLLVVIAYISFLTNLIY